MYKEEILGIFHGSTLTTRDLFWTMMKKNHDVFDEVDSPPIVVFLYHFKPLV